MARARSPSSLQGALELRGTEWPPQALPCSSQGVQLQRGRGSMPPGDTGTAGFGQGDTAGAGTVPARPVITAQLGASRMKPEPGGEQGEEERPSVGTAVSPGPAPAGRGVGNQDLAPPSPHPRPHRWLTVQDHGGGGPGGPQRSPAHRAAPRPSSEPLFPPTRCQLRGPAPALPCPGAAEPAERRGPRAR